MHAMVQDKYGSGEVLETRDIEKPEIGPDEVLVRVRAAGVNPADWAIMSGLPYVARPIYGLRKPKNGVRGTDVAGTVETVGATVTRFKPGDEVFGWSKGSFADFAAASEDMLVMKPTRLTFEGAASVPMAGLVALQAVRDRGNVRAGQKVLINGASGGIGTFAVQIAKALGAEVTGVCSTGNVDLVSSIGADHVIDYTRDDFSRGERRYDLVFQLAGTKSASECRRALTPKGTFVPSSGEGRFSGIDRLLSAMVSSPFVSQKIAIWVAKLNRADLVELAELMQSGKVTPVIDRAYTLAETAAAVRQLEGGHTRGKIVISV